MTTTSNGRLFQESRRVQNFSMFFDFIRLRSHWIVGTYRWTHTLIPDCYSFTTTRHNLHCFGNFGTSFREPNGCGNRWSSCRPSIANLLLPIDQLIRFPPPPAIHSQSSWVSLHLLLGSIFPKNIVVPNIVSLVLVMYSLPSSWTYLLVRASSFR